MPDKMMIAEELDNPLNVQVQAKTFVHSLGGVEDMPAERIVHALSKSAGVVAFFSAIGGLIWAIVS